MPTALRFTGYQQECRLRSRRTREVGAGLPKETDIPQEKSRRC